MRKFAVLFAVLSLVLTVAVVAQNPPKIEVFGGYSLLHLDSEGLSGSTFIPGASLKRNYNGVEGSVQYNLNGWFGFTGDLSWHFGTPLNVSGTSVPTAHSLTYLFGPTIYHQAPHARPFAHFLIGGNRISVGSNSGFSGGSDSAASFALGGGLDLKLTNRISVRPGQADWLYTHHNVCQLLGVSRLEGCRLVPHQNNLRFSTGIVFDLGER